MWKCPVCDKEDNAATVCPTCGYERTCDYERYPTAFTVKGAKSTRALRREWQEKQGPALPELVAEWFDAPQDDASAAERCFRRLADGGDPAAQWWLGAAYARGLGAEQDDTRAAQWFDQSARRGYARAQYRLGLSFRDGVGVKADPRKALDWLRKAAAQGHTQARSRLEALESLMPDHLFERYRQEPDQAKRVEYLKKAAQMGYTPAQAELGDCYAQGRGVERDYVKASEWYRRAAGQPPQQPESPQQATKPQQTESPQQLFERYRQESDQVKRMEYLKKAAQQGYAPAQYKLGDCYACGYGVEEDNVQAAQWYQKAAEQGHAEAQATS